MMKMKKMHICGLGAIAGALLSAAGANTGAMPLDANAELASAYRCDLPGPEVWTATPNGRTSLRNCCCRRVSRGACLY